MADISKLKTPDGTTYDFKVYSDHVAPMLSKTFTDVIGTADNWANATFFFGSIRPDSWNTTWRITYKINVYVPNYTNYCQMAIVTVTGKQGDFRSFASFNTIGEYYVCYYHELYRLKSAGFTNGYGHSLGTRFYSAYKPIDTNYKRTIEVEIYETENCSFTFYDSCLKYASIPGTGSTNYNTYTEMDFVTNGMQETGDANDPNYYNRENYGSRTTKNALYRYQFCLTTSTGQLIPVNTVNNSVATNKTLTTEEFDPFGEIFFWASTSTYSAGANVGNSSWYRQYLCDLRYSFNCGGYDSAGTLTARSPLYLVCSPQTNGTVKLHSAPLAQALPSSDDGLVYIYLGRVYQDDYPYRVVLSLNHPVYWYKNEKIVPYVKDPMTNHVVRYNNTNGNNSGKYYKININSYNSWMLNISVKLYHTYRAYDLMVSGYNYGSTHWYSPAATILGASVTNTVAVTFGYDSDWHLWFAIPAEQYSGVAVSLGANGYYSVTDETNLFTIEMVEGLPETVQSTITAYRPWYRNEISGTSPISFSGGAISHANSGVTAASKGDTSNQTPGFGSTFKALSGTVNATGHLTSFADHTVKIPDTKASTSAYGITKLSTSTSSTATDLAATPSAVKIAKDRADEAYTKAATVESGLNGTLIYDHSYTISNGVATFTPHVYLKGEEVTSNYAKSCFVWKYKLANDVTGTPSYIPLTTNNDRTCTVTISVLGYGGYVLGEFTPA